MEDEDHSRAPEQEKEFKFFFREYVDHETNKKKNQDREERERKRRLEEEQKRREAEKNKQRSLEQQKNMELYAKAQAEMARINKIKLEEEAKELAGIDVNMFTQKGNFARIVQSLLENDTNLEMTFSGQDIPAIKMRIIFKAMESNTSLRELVINRKGMTDEEGIDLAKCLEYNRTLERLSLEGNLLGTNFCPNSKLKIPVDREQ